MMLNEPCSHGLLLIDRKAEIVHIDHELARLLGYPVAELLGRRVESLIPERSRKICGRFLERFLRKPRVIRMPAGRCIHVLGKNKVEIPVTACLAPGSRGGDSSIVCMISAAGEAGTRGPESRKVEQPLHAVREMESLGRAVNEIAFDLNTIFQTILGHAEVTRLNPQTSATLDGLDEIIGHSVRGRHVVNRMLTLFGLRSANLCRLDLEQPAAASRDLEQGRENATLSCSHY